MELDLLSIIRKNPLLYEDEPEEEDAIEYQRLLLIKIREKNRLCENILKNMIRTYTQPDGSLRREELEKQLYKTDVYDCTCLHYACKFHMTKTASIIIENTFQESNLYKLSKLNLTPLTMCCKNEKRTQKILFKTKHLTALKVKYDNESFFHKIFLKIIEKTNNEDNLYLGNYALQFCIFNRDFKKAMIILEKTNNEDNLYKLGLRFTSLILSLESTYQNTPSQVYFYPEMLEISKYIIQKTRVQKKLYIPHYIIPLSENPKTAFNYISRGIPYYSVFKSLQDKYSEINSYHKTKINRIFYKNFQKKIYSDDIIGCIASFLYYPPGFISF